MAITRGQLTIVGPESAAELLFQYSIDGSSNWHTVFAEGDLYFRVSSDGGVSWSDPARFAGPSGVSTYVHLAYANSADGSVGFSTSISTGKTYLGQLVSSGSTPSQEYGDYKWQKFVGEDGKGIASTTVGYQLHTNGTTPPTGAWLTDPPTPVQGRYFWVRTITTYTSGDPVITYSVSYLATNGQNGTDGKGITSTVIEYAQTLSGTTTPSSWSSTRPSPEKGQYLWTKTTISYSDSTNSIAYSISYSATDGQKGDKGEPGIEGAPGANGQSQWTHLRYSVASNGNPMVKDPTATTKYIGIAVTNSSTAPTGYASYTWQKFVGEDGDDGKGISSTVITYANHTNGTTAPTTGWQATPAPIKGQYLWTRTVTTYTDGSTIPTYSVAYQATDGQAGKGISSTVVEYAQTTSGTTTPTAWSGTRPAPIKGQYLWSKTTITYTDTTTSVSYSTSYSATDGQKGDPGIPGTPGDDGQQYWTWIKYADSPTTGMSDLPANKAYIGIAHNQTLSTESSVYTDYTWSLIKGDKGDKGATGEQGPRGENGTSVTGIVENYLATPLATGVTKATSGWKTTMQPLTSTNRYLWNYETIQFSAGDPQDTIPVIIGVYGDTGRALTGITEYYLASASSTGVTRPATDGTNGWTTTPQVTTPDLPYLWNYEKLTWNAAPTTSYINPIVIAIHGAKGDKGDQGVQGIQGTTGAAGQSQWTHLRYSTAANGNPFVPTPTAATKYIGIAVTATSTAPTGYASYTWQKFVGENGGQGIQGPAGANGQPTYTWIRYADNASGAGIVDTPAGKDYIGIAHNKLTATESNTPGDYTWSLIKGAPGRSITAVDVHYAKHTNATTAPTTGWSTTAPAWENGKYIWSKTVTTYSTGDPTESTPVCITGQAGSTGGTGRGVSSIVEQFYLSTSKTTQVGGNWITTMPVWENGKYVWTRSLITYTSGAPATSTTEPLVSSEWEAASDALEDAKDYTDEIDRKNETKSGNLLTKTFTGPDFEDLTVRGAFRLEALARAKGQGTINVYQADGEKTRVYSVEIDSEEFEQVKTGDAVVAGRNLLRNLLGNGGYRIGSSAAGITTRIDEDGNLEITAAEGNQNYLSDVGMLQFGPAISASVKIGDIVTFSTDIRTENSAAMPTFYIQPSMSYMTLSGTISGEFSRAYSTRVQVSDPSWTPHFGFQGLKGAYVLKRPVYRLGESSLYTPAHEDIDGNVRIEVTGTIEFESLELYQYSIVPAWVTDWSGTATKVGENYVLSPYIFSGQIDINGLATGVSMGMDLTPGDPKPASNIYGYSRGELTYQLTGNVFEMMGLNGTSAGLSTLDTTGQGVRFWAGASHQDRNLAPFRVLEDGTLHASKAVIQGSFILTDPNSSNLVVKDTLGSFAYETANLLDDTSGTFETIQLRETVQYRLSSIRVGEDVFLKSGDNLVFTAKLSTPPASVKVGITLVSEIEQEIEEVIDDEIIVRTILVEHIEEVYGTISPPQSTDPDQSIYTARVDVTIPTGTIYLYPFYVFGDTSNPITWPDNLGGRNLLTVDSGNIRMYGLSEVYALDSAITFGEEYTLTAKVEITDIYTEKVRISVPRESMVSSVIGIEEVHANGGLIHFSSTSINGDPNSSNWWETGILVEFLNGNDQPAYGTIEWVQIWKGDIPLANMTSWEPPRITPPGQLIDLEHREQMVSRGEAISIWRPSFNSLSKSVDDKRFVMNYADGLFSQSVETSEYREKMAEFNRAIEVKANISDIPDVPAILTQYMTEDYWGLETLKTTVNQYGEAVTIVQDSMGYEFINPDLPDLGKNLIFRSAGSAMSLALKSDRISFRSGTQEVAWISGSSLHIASATIVSSLVIGGHMFEQWKDDKKYTVIRAV